MLPRLEAEEQKVNREIALRVDAEERLRGAEAALDDALTTVAVYVAGTRGALRGLVELEARLHDALAQIGTEKV